VLADPFSLGARVVILDAVGHAQAIGLGEMLAVGGAEAICVTPLPLPMALDGETQAAILPRAVQAGMVWRPNTVLASIGDHDTMLVDTLSRKPETLTGVDTVVIRTHGLPEDSLYRALEGKVPELELIGDARAVRVVDRAVYDGHVAARAL